MIEHHPTDSFENAETEIVMNGFDCAKLRYIGSQGHPICILIHIDIGQIFTVGRVDVSKPTKTSDFEFHRKTKAVSRRHALIGRSEEGYYIEDIGSSAGTFVDHIRIHPHVRHKIESGTQISFGNLGADYIFEE